MVGRVSARDDACRFLAAYLTSPAALEAPLILLGQPGSGKSVLTRILAARLPTTDFLTIRVELRQVPAEADLQDQIEFAVRASTGEGCCGRGLSNRPTAPAGRDARRF